MSKAKVCHVISGYFRTDARIFRRQCKSLLNNGFEVIILTNDGGEKEVIDGVSIVPTRIFWSNRFMQLIFGKHQFLKDALAINADVYQLHSPELLPLVRPLQRRGKKVVYDAHEDMPNHILEKEWIPYPLRKLFSSMFAKYMNRVFKSLDYLISPIHHVVDKAHRVNPNVAVIPNFPLYNNQTLNNENYLERENTLCYAGTVYRYSNQEEILEALNSIKYIQYEVAGHFEPDHLDSLKELSSFYKLKFHGRLNFEELTSLLGRATMGVVIYEYTLNMGYNLGSFGTNKIFEYMEAGLPVICTDYKLWKEVIDENSCGICVKPNDSQQIKEAIEFLINNKEEAMKMGMRGREAVLSKYNWNSIEKVYLPIFDSLILA